MIDPTKRRMAALFLCAVILLASAAATPASTEAGTPGHQFVKRAGPTLRLHGQTFRFAGSNNYYLMYKSPFMVDDVLERASASGFTVMRTWGFLEIGNEDGSNSIHGKADGIYFQYWDGTGPTYNDGPDGLEKLDYILYKARQEGIRLIIPLTNNWKDFGGMDQYVRWRGGRYHDEFYTDPVIRQWYKDWIAHLLNRTNVYTGIKYKDDPTVMLWELANEPRCKGSGLYPTSPDCSTGTITTWADEMSRYIKSIDSKHLVSVGDEGFYCDPGATDWTENCNEGIDSRALARLDQVDVISFHLYPDHWGKGGDWGVEWIKRHLADGRAVNKPVILGEYGWQDKATRNQVFKRWSDTLFAEGGAGALYWILSGYQDDGSLYPDYDGFTVYCPSPVCTAMENFSATMGANRVLAFPPIADHDRAVTDFETAVTLDPAANDIAYGNGNVVDPAMIDLDPSTVGQQSSRAVAGGTLERQPDGTVRFLPERDFAGKAVATYTIADAGGERSNEATLEVTVLPDPGAPLQLFTFESGTEGWGPASWEPDAGTVARSTTFVTEGSYGLQVDSIEGGWFGRAFETPVDLSTKSTIKLDLHITGENGSWHNIAIETGDGWRWCQGTGEWVPGGETLTAELDLLDLSCDDPDLSRVRTIRVYFNGDGYLDNVRAE